MAALPPTLSDSCLCCCSFRFINHPHTPLFCTSSHHWWKYNQRFKSFHFNIESCIPSTLNLTRPFFVLPPITGGCTTPCLRDFTTLPALTGWTRQLKRCSNRRVQPVVGRALSDQSKSQLVGQICPTGPGWSCATGPRNWLDRPVRPAGRCFGRTVPVQPPVKHGCLSTAWTAVFDRLMPAVPQKASFQEGSH